MKFFGIGKTKLSNKELVTWASPHSVGGGITMKAWQTYYHLVFIPMVPSDKEIKLFCNKTNEEIRFDIPMNAIEEVRKFQSELRAPIWTFIGFPAIFAAVVLLSS